MNETRGEMELETILKWWPMIAAAGAAVASHAVTRAKVVRLEESHKDTNDRIEGLKRDLAAQRAEDLAREVKQFDEVKAKLDLLIERSMRS